MSSTRNRTARPHASDLSGDRLDKARICAVIVTYHPDRGLPSRVGRIVPHVDAVVVVDNQSDADELNMLRDVCASPGAVDLIANAENRGVAAALNQGLQWAQARGYAWALMLDQDTTPTDRLVPTLAAVHHDAQATKRIAVIGANYVDDDPTGADYRRRAGGDGGRGWIETATVLTSGSAVSLRAFEEIGPFREELFIDHVDHEYCLRARARGFSVLLACEPLMTHSIGLAAKRRLLGTELRTQGHSAQRWYFKTRNLIVVVRRYWRREFRWALAAVVWHVKTTATMAMFERERWANLRDVMVGTWDGWRGRLGGYRGHGDRRGDRCVGGDGRTAG